ncbi:monovalent cation/H+ antiporter complex subunit F [Flaviflexus massiliensis]|uniref:monovalent cation/H+ antiporter complex subunit F n=1 Tax=Flaviflexus massiliensis TaxID=1522309 RepID=UPI0006D5A920|nr:monovalent cation/H+ antiporter complex subunit F [Flaviflexus massiliensis]
MTLLTVVSWICGILLFLAAIGVVIRVSRGPSMLDRMVAVDLFTSTILAAMMVISAVTRRTDLLPVLVILAIVGFIGSTTIARFAAHEPTADKRILTKDEVAKILADAKIRADDDDEEVHNPDQGEDEGESNA